MRKAAGPVIIALMLFSILALAFPIQPSNATSTSVSNCASVTRAEYLGMNRNEAMQNAQDSAIFVKASASLTNVSYYSTFEAGTALPPACNISNMTADVVFAADSSTGFAFLVVVENASTLNPIGVQVRLNPPSLSYCSTSPCNNPIWAGYEVYANSGATYNVWAASSDFNASTATYPSTGCNSYRCDVASWVGLEDENLGGDGNLVQTGIDATCIGSGCSANYSEVYEFVGAPAVFCNTGVRGGDSISASVTDTYTSGGPKDEYLVYVTDSRSGTYCQVEQTYSSMSSPTIGAFVTESPKFCNTTTCAPLAEFGTVLFNDAEIYNSTSQYQFINVFTQKGYDYQDIMKNAPVNRLGACGTAITNVSPGSVVPYGQFKDEWITGQYTPYWLTKC